MVSVEIQKPTAGVIQKERYRCHMNLVILETVRAGTSIDLMFVCMKIGTLASFKREILSMFRWRIEYVIFLIP